MKESTEIRTQINVLEFQIKQLESALISLFEDSSSMFVIKNNLSKIATQNGLWTGNEADKFYSIYTETNQVSDKNLRKIKRNMTNIKKRISQLQNQITSLERSYEFALIQELSEGTHGQN